MSQTNGVVLFAYNNAKIDYTKLAIITALSVKTNLTNNNIALLTDASTYDHLKNTQHKSLIDKCFDKIIVETLRHDKNTRLHHDSPDKNFTTQFSNGNKHNVFNLTPWDKTLLIDVDYILGNNSLDKLFDTDYELALFRTAKGLRMELPHHEEQRLHPEGIDMWWSTVIYWTKNEQSTQFFNMWHHVKDNYDYYKFLYKFPGRMFRTDYASAIAIHLLNGQMEGNFVNEIPPGVMRYMDQKDDLIQVNGKNDFTFLSHYNNQKPSKDIVVRVQGQDIHMMNKMALLRHYDKLLEVYNV